MKRSKRLETVVDLAKRKLDKAGQALAFIQQQLGDEENKLAQLQEYLVEYRTTIQTAGAQGLSVQAFRRYNDFSDNVAKAIAQQTQQVATVKQQVEQIRRHWQMLDARHKGLLKLRDKSLLDEAAAYERAQQKELDELAGRWHLKKPLF